MQLAKIESIGVHHPPLEVSTEDLLRDSGLTELGADADAVSRKLGITHVRFSADEEYPSDLAVRACHDAFAAADVSPGDIDALFYCGIDRDAQEPSTACFVADKLGMNDSHLSTAMDITNACHGFTAAIEVAEPHLILGRWRHVLICTGEKASNRFKEMRAHIQAGKYTADQVSELEGFFSCGDVGAAMILSASTDGSGIVHIKTATRPAHARSCQVGDLEDRVYKVMRMRQICYETFSLIRSVHAYSQEFLTGLGWHNEDINYFIQHQVGKVPYTVCNKLFGFDKSRSPRIFERLGNLTSGSIPAALKECDIKRGDKVLVNSTGSGIVVSQMAFIA